MSKIGCICGNVIIDQTDDIAYKAKFVRDQDWESYSGSSITDIASFVEAVKIGQTETWIKAYFSKDYPFPIDTSSIIHDIILRYNSTFENSIYQCESCGRIKIQVKDTNDYASFKPEDEKHQHIFKRLREEKNGS